MILAIALSAAAVACSLTAVVVAFATRKKIMDPIERLQNLVTTLNETIIAESAQQIDAIKNLREAINNDGHVDELNRIADELEASIGRVKSIVPDAAAPLPTVEPPSGQSTGDAPVPDTPLPAEGGDARQAALGELSSIVDPEI
jgi:hypothetical protein